MDLNTAINARKSIRRYADRPIERALLDELLTAANLAPSWKNVQSSRYYVACTPEGVDKVRECLPEFNRNNVKNAPVLIVTAFEKGQSGYGVGDGPANELGEGWGIYDLGLNNENLLLKAAELGIGSLVMGIRDEKALREALGIPETQVIVSVIALGYPDGTEVPRRPRKDVSEISKFF